jgi:hypothetical protein
MRRILFPAPLTFDLIGYGNDALIEEILLRSRLTMATFNDDITAYGIVDSVNPQTAIAGGTRPFSVGINNTVTTTLNVQAGTAVFRSGEIIIISEPVVQVALADYTPNSRNIVYLEFNEKENDPVLTRYNTLVNSKVSYLDSNADYIKVLKKDDYDALSLDDLDRNIPLAIVTTQLVTSSSGVGTTTRIAIDMTANTYAGNRPWYSVVDAAHRSHIGTGAITNVNIHGLSINDLSAAGDLTFLQVALDHGMIVSKDRGLAGVPGYLCTETISSVLTDTSGSITGIPGAKYFSLSRIPLQVHRVELPIKAYGSITNPAGTLIAEDESFTLDDGQNSAVVFYFDTDNSIVETNTVRRIPYTGSNTATQIRNSIVAAINNAPVLNITAVTPLPGDTTGVTNLKHDTAGTVGNVLISDTVASSSFIITGMIGGIIKDLSHFWVPGSNIVGLLPNDEYIANTSLKIYYSAVDAAEPLVQVVNPTFKVRTANTSEVIVSGGLFLNNITGTELSFENEGPIPSKYTVYVDKNGSLQKFPQTVYCYKKLNDIGSTLQSFENSILGPSRLRVWLAHSTAIGETDIQIQITGQDTAEQTITETVKFKAKPAKGSIKAVDGTMITDDSIFTINDGVNPAVVFEFDSNSSFIPETNTQRRIVYNTGEISSLIAAHIRDAINNAPVLNMTATIVGSDLVVITNTIAGSQGNHTITTNTGMVVTGMADGGGWSENVAPSCSENSNQYIDTDTIWNNVSNLIVSVRNNDNANTAVLIQALIDPVGVSSISDVLPVAEIIWNGQQVCYIRDIRPINTYLSLPNYLAISSAAPITASYYAGLGAPNKLYQYWAEDFDKPKYVTTEVVDTTILQGFIPTVTSVTKLSKGLGRNDTYISRPIPVKPYTGGNANKLKFVPVQAGAAFTIKVRYYRAGTTNAWQNWVTLSSPYELSIAFPDVIKWQMVVTGPVEGIYAIMTVNTAVTTVAGFTNLGAFVDGVFQ